MARNAKSIERLKSEIQSAYPGTTIWTIGDTSHQNSYSDHNPNAKGVICAADVKGDHGLKLSAFVKHLINDPHPNLRYVIHARKIYERDEGFRSKDYYGKNPHDTHVHVSVGNGPDGRSTHSYDSTAAWNIDDISSAPSTPAKPTKPSTNWSAKLMSELPLLRNGSKGLPVNRLQALLNVAGAGVKEDGHFGPRTENAVRRFQDHANLSVDGIVGKNTWTKLVKG
jgi:hypothetical protein